MRTIFSFLQNKRILSDCKVWLSGAVPEREHWSHGLVDRDILEFVSVFSALVFERGGTIVHGSHPSFTPTLKRQAEKFAKNVDQLKLFISSEWHGNDASQNRSRKYEMYVLPAVYTGEKFERNESLTILRNEMAKASNSAVFIGGKLHLKSTFVPGVEEEMKLALKYGIPSYVLAGVDGLAKERTDPSLLISMNPHVDQDKLSQISSTQDLFLAPSMVLSSLSEIRKRLRPIR